MLTHCTIDWRGNITTPIGPEQHTHMNADMVRGPVSLETDPGHLCTLTMVAPLNVRTSLRGPNTDLYLLRERVGGLPW